MTEHATTIRCEKCLPLAEFLEENEYMVEQLDAQIWQVNPIGGTPIFLATEGETLYFEMSLGVLGALEHNAKVLYHLLDVNSEIAPASVAINSTNDPAELCLVGRLERTNLDSNEILGMLACLGLASLRVQQLLD